MTHKNIFFSYLNTNVPDIYFLFHPVSAQCFWFPLLNPQPCWLPPWAQLKGTRRCPGCCCLAGGLSETLAPTSASGGEPPGGALQLQAPISQVLQKVSATGRPSIPNPGLCNLLCAMLNGLRISVLVSCQLNNSSQKDKTIRAASPCPLSPFARLLEMQCSARA